MIYQTLYSKISDILEDIPQIKAVYPYPATKLEQYPAAVFFPASFDNSFQSTKDNMKVYRFHLFVVVGATQKSIVDIYGTVLPKTVDAVVQAFDDGWDGGTIEGHRTWLLINSGDWTMNDKQNGLEAIAELSVEIRLTTTNA